MWRQTTLGSPRLGHQSGPAKAGNPKYGKQAPPNNAKYKQRKIKSHTSHHQRPRYPGTRRPITRRHPRHDPPAPRGQRRAHDGRQAPVEPDPRGQVSHLKCCSATGRPQLPHFLLGAAADHLHESGWGASPGTVSLCLPWSGDSLRTPPETPLPPAQPLPSTKGICGSSLRKPLSPSSYCRPPMWRLRWLLPAVQLPLSCGLYVHLSASADSAAGMQSLRHRHQSCAGRTALKIIPCGRCPPPPREWRHFGPRCVVTLLKHDNLTPLGHVGACATDA